MPKQDGQAVACYGSARRPLKPSFSQTKRKQSTFQSDILAESWRLGSMTKPTRLANSAMLIPAAYRPGFITRLWRGSASSTTILPARPASRCRTRPARSSRSLRPRSRQAKTPLPHSPHHWILINPTVGDNSPDFNRRGEPFFLAQQLAHSVITIIRHPHPVS